MPTIIHNLAEAEAHKAAEYFYNAMDCCITAEVLGELLPMLDADSTAKTYSLERALQNPLLEMMLRGIRVDMPRRMELIGDLSDKQHQVNEILNVLSAAVWAKPLNANSPKQLIDFFYFALGLPKTYIYDKGERRLSTNRETLEKLRAYLTARPFVNCILKSRDLGKKIATLKSGISADGRMRTAYKIAGTETGRLASSSNAFGDGTNLQNWSHAEREILIADDGMIFAYIDLEQAESRAVAYISGDEAYIEACESGDLHSTVSKMLWPNKEPRAMFYRGFTYRDMSKRAGHGSNYIGQPYTMSRHLKIPAEVVEHFQDLYFSRFPGIKKGHRQVATKLQSEGFLITPFGRKRQFFSRRNDAATLREAVAFLPQSTIGDYMDTGLVRAYHRVQRDKLPVQFLAQVHDAILIQMPIAALPDVLPKVRAELSFALPVTDFYGRRRTMTIPTSAEVGYNWNDYSKNNLDGLKAYVDGPARKRIRAANLSLLDTRVS